MLERDRTHPQRHHRLAGLLGLALLAVPACSLFQDTDSRPAGPDFEYVELDAAYIAYERDVGDIDGDGDNDIVAVQEGDADLQVFRAPTWERSTLLRFTGPDRYPRADDLKLADINGDGRPDVVTRLAPGPSDQGAGVAVWCENLGTDEGFRQHRIGDSPRYVKDIVTADFDGDGRLDVAMRMDSRTQIWFQKTPGTWTEVSIDHPPREGLEAGDLNGDGLPDLILNGFWLETPGSPEEALASDNYGFHVIDDRWMGQGGDWRADACKVAVGDFDGDGAVDVALSHSERPGYDVTWYRSTEPGGAGPWEAHPVTAADYCHTLRAADFNGDGRVDLLVGGMVRSRHRGLTLLLNREGGTDWTEHPIQADGSYSAELGDIDEDGDPDIVGIRNNDSAPTWIYRNEAVYGLDFWTYRRVTDRHARTFGLCFPDVNGDGWRDIASGPFVYLNPGPDAGGDWTQIPLPDAVHAFTTIDVDGDDLADLIALQDDPEGERVDIFWVEAADAEGTSWTGPLRIGDVPRSGHSAGFQGSRTAQIIPGGRPEIVISSVRGLYSFCAPDSSPETAPWNRTFIAANTSDEGIGAADVDGDGFQDISFTTGENKSVCWARNPGDGSGDWSVFRIGTFPEADFPDRCAAADLDGDGLTDIIVTEENRGLEPDAMACWWKQPADGATGGDWPRRTIATQFTINSMDVGDVDHDGDMDVVLAEHRGTMRIAIWANDGRGGFSEHLVGEGHESHLGARLVDLDGDGNLDLVSIAYDTPGEIHLWHNDSPAAPGDPATDLPSRRGETLTEEGARTILGGT